ncbi:MAG: tRNA uridine-5-carboxymethylaminomethyl(34) synthesis GTPase MnmE [Vicinamibacteraceae bacterium]
MFSTDDTIVAIATPPGRAGLGVVRIAGPQAVTIAGVLAPGAALHARVATVRRLAAPLDGPTSAARGVSIDQVVLTWFATPASYTGDDVVEISAHGSPVLLDRIIRSAMRAGARLAAPGEFTLRAFLNGKLDLVQAEAVADLIDAVTPAQARMAFDQLDGTLSHALAAIGEALFDLRVRLEASLDFPDEGYHFVEPGAVARECETVRDRVTALLETARRGRLLREGCTVALVGAPNVGKSLLFNALLGAGRAIVTAVPGTTRDLLTERCDIGGLAVTLIDTAGVRDSDEPIEREGIARARQAAQTADVRVVVLDRSRPRAETGVAMGAETGAASKAEAAAETSALSGAVARNTTVIVANKSDLPSAWTEADERASIAASALTGEGLDAVRQAIVRAAVSMESLEDPPSVANARHVGLLERVEARVGEAADQARSGEGEEIVLATLQDAFAALDEIVGKRSSEDVLRQIFARFCIGK